MSSIAVSTVDGCTATENERSYLYLSRQLRSLAIQVESTDFRCCFRPNQNEIVTLVSMPEGLSLSSVGQLVKWSTPTQHGCIIFRRSQWCSNPVDNVKRNFQRKIERKKEITNPVKVQH